MPADPELLPVSVVIPLYHGAERHLRQLAASLRSQGAAEVIVVIDDDSTPAAIEAILGSIPNLRVLVSDGQGAGMARNFGAAAATKEWVTFLDHDDWWPERFLADLLAGATSDVVGYDSEVFLEDEDGRQSPAHETLFDRVRWNHDSIDVARSRLLLHGFPLVKLLLRRQAFAAVGGFRPIYAVEDFDLVWRLLAAGSRIDLPRSPVGAYLVHASSTTGTVKEDHQSYERAQRSWLQIWSGMARSSEVPLRARLEAASKLGKVAARIVARRVRDRIRGQSSR